jgi:tRNA uridine 5-carboxymethylaminomethyl modification enzyme
MFTSRAEYRLSLREDNADLRLTERGRELGLVDDVRWSLFERKRAAVATELRRLSASVVHPAQVDDALLGRMGQPLTRETHAVELLRRPEISYADLRNVAPLAPPDSQGDWRSDARLAEQVPFQVEVQAKYSGYLKRQSQEIDRQLRHEELRLPCDLDYEAVGGLSNEARQRLRDVRPETLGQAARIPGLTPAAVSLLLVHLKKRDYAA